MIAAKLRAPLRSVPCIEPLGEGVVMHFSDKDPTDLGNVVASLGFASKEALQDALSSAESLDMLIGQYLISKGVINEAQLREALQVQRDLRGPDRMRQALAVAKVAVQSRSHLGEMARNLTVKSQEVRSYCTLAKARGR